VKDASPRPMTANVPQRSTYRARPPLATGASPKWSTGSGRLSPHTRTVTPNAMLDPAPSLTSKNAQRQWSGVSYVADKKGGWNPNRTVGEKLVSSRAGGNSSHASAVSPVPGVENVTSSASAASDRNWHKRVFSKHLPSGRGDVARLRKWLEVSLDEVSHKGKGDLFTFSEDALKLYNTAYQELTRQVSVSCVDHGRLMADLWTSHAELTGRVLTDLINERAGTSAAFASMADENRKLVDEAESLRAQLRQRDLDLVAHKRRLERFEELSLRYNYKGETWEEQDEARVGRLNLGQLTDSEGDV